MKIFLSYGHDDNSKLVERIRNDLEKPENGGHQCWMDTKEIKAGDDWRRAITDGIVSSQWVLSFLSRHACREWEEHGQRKKGVCLDELAIAIGTKGSIVKTILVESPTEPDKLNPPLTVSHVQYLDMHNWKAKLEQSEDDFEAWYADKFSEILRIVNDPSNQKFAGEIETLREKLLPLDNASRIGELMANDFVGREWLLEEIDHWLKYEPQQKVFCLTGDPGFGKSAISAWLAYQNKPEIIAAHFCQYNQPNYSDPSQVICSIAFQMATRLPDYRRFLFDKLRTLEYQSINMQMQQQLKILTQSTEIGKDGLRQLLALIEQSKKTGSLAFLKPAELFQALIADAASFTIGGDRQRLLVIIDALDEAGSSLVEFLAQHQGMLPSWIALFVTSRPNDNGIRQYLKMLNPHFQDIADTRNREDVKGWIIAWLTGRGVLEQCQDEMLNPLLEASQGNFHYLCTFRHMVEHNSNLLEHPETYPQGMDSLYHSFFQRQFPITENYRQWQAPFLRLIAAARRPLPLDLAKRVLDLNTEEWNIRVLSPIGSLFHVIKAANGETIQPFHKSLRDWMSDGKRADQYFVDSDEGHFKLAEVLWNDFINVDKFEDYALDELPYHLINLSNEKLRTLIPDDATWEKYRSRMIKIAITLFETLSYHQSESWYRIILRLDEEIFGSEHPATAYILNNLGELLRVNACYIESELLLHRALIIRQEVFGDEHPDTAITLNNLALLFQIKREFEIAEQYLLRALEIFEKSLGAEHPNSMNTLSNLADLLRTKGDGDKAESLYYQALNIRRKVLGPEHPDTAITINNLALLLEDKGDFSEAESYFKLALDIFAKAFGTEHPNTACPMNNLAELLRIKGDLDKAEPLYYQALNIRRKILGPEHPDTAITINNLALLLQAKRDFIGAESQFQLALKIFKNAFGEQHEFTARTLNNLAEMFEDKGDFVEAEKLYHQALKSREETLGADHMDTTTTRNSLARLLQTKGDLDGAELLFYSNLMISKKVFGDEHPDTAISFNNLASMLQVKGDFDAAESNFLSALIICENVLEANHPNTLAIRKNLVELHRVKSITENGINNCI